MDNRNRKIVGINKDLFVSGDQIPKFFGPKRIKKR